MKERTFKIISQVLNVPIEEISENSSPDNLEMWDSMNTMNLILALEEEFDVQFSDEQIPMMMNAGLIIEILNEMKGADK